MINMNDIHRARKHFHVILFADDTHLTYTIFTSKMQQETPGKTLSLAQMVNNELKLIQIWLEVKKIITKRKEN